MAVKSSGFCSFSSYFSLTNKGLKQQGYLTNLSILLKLTCDSCLRAGLILILSADVLLWLNAVTEDTIQQEIELEKQGSASGLAGNCFEALLPSRPAL